MILCRVVIMIPPVHFTLNHLKYFYHKDTKYHSLNVDVADRKMY